MFHYLVHTKYLNKCMVSVCTEGSKSELEFYTFRLLSISPTMWIVLMVLCFHNKTTKFFNFYFFNKYNMKYICCNFKLKCIQNLNCFNAPHRHFTCLSFCNCKLLVIIRHRFSYLETTKFLLLYPIIEEKRWIQNICRLHMGFSQPWI